MFADNVDDNVVAASTSGKSDNIIEGIIRIL